MVLEVITEKKSIGWDQKHAADPRSGLIMKSECLSFPISLLEMRCEKVSSQGGSLSVILKARDIWLCDLEFNLGIR